MSSRLYGGLARRAVREPEPQRGVSRVAAIQMASGPQVPGNLREAERLIEMAVEQGAQLVALPEYFPIMGMQDTDKVKAREEPGHGRIQNFLSETAKKHGIWLIGGSAPLVASVPDKVRNSCLVFDDRGERVARYDKIHLFGFEMGAES
ncbi:MAG: nitrilase-related carbon-nitrogen hydrolase, partial [Burkholderiales bacterium]